MKNFNIKPPEFLGLGIGLIIAGTFLYIIYRFLPLGLALVITGGCLATLSRDKNDKVISYIGYLSAWLYPIGIIYSFIYHGWIIGLISIVLGYIGYRYAKS